MERDGQDSRPYPSLTVLQVKSGVEPIINYALGILYYIKILIFIKFFYKKVKNTLCKTKGI